MYADFACLKITSMLTMPRGEFTDMMNGILVQVNRTLIICECFVSLVFISFRFVCCKPVKFLSQFLF